MTGRTQGPLDVATAKALMSMGDHPRAHSQLEGAVALHNILERERVAYLADEVGLGKTYTALATLALYRHFNPDFRVLVIAPRQNIQRKWSNDWTAFVRNNWLIPDLRVKGAAGGPAREVVLPDRLSDLAYETTVDPDRDFICRLTSFSFALFGEYSRVVQGVRRALPWISAESFPSQESESLRDFVAQAYNSALPHFDLVIIDEAHNLGGGVAIHDGAMEPTSIRNAMLAQVLGHPDMDPQSTFAETYRPLADRVLMLSATPIETSYASLWNQVDLAGKARPKGRKDFSSLMSHDDREASEAARRIMIRRINALEVNGNQLTKNLYRRTWHQGGVSEFDEQLPRGSNRERLTVALVQKLVADEIGSRFDGRFQMGMLASFESFTETAMRVSQSQRADDDFSEEQEGSQGIFDGGDQADTDAERLGADTELINRLSASHLKEFDHEMAHPKMDAVVRDLSQCWQRGDKALVFVRRIATVRELKRKLDESYDQWLFKRLEENLPGDVWRQIAELRDSYQAERKAKGRSLAEGQPPADSDSGGSDTFFAWFFRGKGPEMGKESTIMSGASVAQAVYAPDRSAATFFAHHYVSLLLDCTPSESSSRLSERVRKDPAWVKEELSKRAARYLLSEERRHRFDAVQLAALELLSELGVEEATTLLHAIGTPPQYRKEIAKLDPTKEMSVETFFTRLREYPELKKALQVHRNSDRDPTSQNSGDWLRQQAFANMLIAAAARLGHSLIDLYVAMMRATGPKSPDQAITNFLKALDQQRQNGDRSGAFWELHRLVADQNLQLIRSKNLPRTLTDEFRLSDAPRRLGEVLGSQQPTVGMAGRVNATAVQQFRMPGYPNVLVCTDVLREGEDLHLFCDRVVHYGVAWTPSALEQRNGRIDRLYSLAERRLNRIDADQRDVEDHEKIQIQVPYVPDTIEVLQVRRVFEDMHRFTELMHANVVGRSSQIDMDTEFVRQGAWEPPVVRESLMSTFEINRERDLSGDCREPAVPSTAISAWWQRLCAVADEGVRVGEFNVEDRDDELRTLYASRVIPAYPGDSVARVQPFTLKLASRGALPLVQITTPIGRMDAQQLDELRLKAASTLSRVTVSEDAADREYNAAMEGNVVLGNARFDRRRIVALVDRVTKEADYLERTVTGSDLTMKDVERTLKVDMKHDF